MGIEGSAIAAPADAPVRAEAIAFAGLASDAAFAAEWDALAADAAEPNPFAERWFIAASRHLDPPGSLRLVTVRQGRDLIGLLPLYVAPRYGRLPIRHVENWSHYHHFLGIPLVRSGAEQPFWTGLLDALDSADWAPGLLHLTGLTEDGVLHRALMAAAQARGTRCDTVHRIERALLETTLSPDAYYAATVRKKKRKEIARLQNRLAELGTVMTRRFAAEDDLAAWTEDFLALERSGWKGRAGSALACDPATAAFFREALEGAHAAGKLELIRLELDGRLLAMLVNFLTPPGSFSFKIAFDEDYARYSPGVLIQLDNLKILDRPEIGWMDSCAVEDHSMINSLWGERRGIVRVTLPLSGTRRAAQFALARAAETAAAAIRRRRAAAAPDLQPEE